MPLAARPITLACLAAVLWQSLSGINSNGIHAAEPPAPEIANANNKIRQALNELTEIQFVDIPIREGLEYLSDLHAITIELDPSATEAIGDLNAASVTLNIRGSRLEDALMLLRHPFNLSFLVANGKLLIATHEEVRRQAAPLPVDFKEILAVLAEHKGIEWEPLLRGEIHEVNATTLFALKEALYDKNAIVQLQAANALFWLTETDRIKSTIPHLKTLAASNDRQLRRAAYRALAALGREDLKTLPFLMEKWPLDEAIRSDMGMLIREYNERVYVELEEYFRDGPRELRVKVLQSAMGQPKFAKGLVLLGLADSDRRIRQISLRMVSDLDPSEDVVETLQPFLKSDDPFERLNSGLLLLHVDASSRDAVEVLLKIIAGGGQLAATTLSEFQALPSRIRSAWSLKGTNGHDQSANKAQGAWKDALLKTMKQLNEVSTSDQRELQWAATMALAQLHSTGAKQFSELNWGPVKGRFQSTLSVDDSNTRLDAPPTIRLQIRKSDMGHFDMGEGPDVIQGDLILTTTEPEASSTVAMMFSNRRLITNGPFDVIEFDAESGADPILPKIIGKYFLQFRSKYYPASNVLTINFDEKLNAAPADRKPNSN